MTKRFVTGSKSSFHSDKCCSEFQQWSNGKFANQAWKSNQKRLTSVLKHLSLHFLLEGQMVICNQVRAVKNAIIPLADKSHLMSLSPLQQVAGGSCLTALGAPAAPALVSLPRSQQCPSSLLSACLHLGPFQGPWEPQIRDFQSQTGHRMAYCSSSGAKAVLTEVDFGPAKEQSLFPVTSQGSSLGLFFGKAPPAEGRALPRAVAAAWGSCWEVGTFLCHTDCHNCSRTASTSLLLTQPQSKQMPSCPALVCIASASCFPPLLWQGTARAKRRKTCSQPSEQQSILQYTDLWGSKYQERPQQRETPLASWGWQELYHWLY